MNTEYPGFQNWWRPMSDSGAEYLPEYSPVRLWPELLAPRGQPARLDDDGRRVFFAWWVAPES